MTLLHLTVREIRFRKLSFLLGVLGVTVAVGCLVAELLLLRRHDLVTGQILAAKEAETKKLMDKHEDDVRKTNLKLGFNLLILPKDQSLNDLYDEERVPVYMPEEYAEKLARNRVATINHVLPTLTRKVKWPEQSRKVVLMGVKGEVFIQSASQKPLLEAVPAGSVVLGFELYQSLKLKKDQTLRFMGRDFRIGKLVEEKGNADGITIWMNLKEAQDLLGLSGEVNAIMALECNCSPDRLDKIRAEIGALLPDAKVIELASQAITRAEARTQAAQLAEETLLREKTGRVQLRRQLESFAAFLLPTVMAGSGPWIGLLAFGNVRDRRQEIGVLRAVGLGSRQVFVVFVGRAVFMGLAGAVLGLAAGIFFGVNSGEPAGAAQALALGQLLDPQAIVLALIAAPALAIVASWIPALMAVKQDPAIALQDR